MKDDKMKKLNDNFYNENEDLIGEKESQSDNIAFDAYTGNTLVTQNKNSKEEKVIAENTPAYWHYDAMKDKNMLTQMSGANSYLVPETYDFLTERITGIERQLLKK